MSVSSKGPVTIPLSFCSWFLKNQVRRTGFLVYFKLDFYCLCSLQKSISKLILQAKNPVRRTWLFQLDFSKFKYRSIWGKLFYFCILGQNSFWSQSRILFVLAWLWFWSFNFGNINLGWILHKTSNKMQLYKGFHPIVWYWLA